MGNLAGAIKKLGNDGSNVQVLFISVDPEHDTPALLKQYVSTFNPTFLGLSGDLQTTKNIGPLYRSLYSRPGRKTSLIYQLWYKYGYNFP